MKTLLVLALLSSNIAFADLDRSIDQLSSRIDFRSEAIDAASDRSIERQHEIREIAAAREGFGGTGGRD